VEVDTRYNGVEGTHNKHTEDSKWVLGRTPGLIKNTGGFVCTQENGAGSDKPLPGGSHGDGWMGGQTLDPEPILLLELSSEALCLDSRVVKL
jgi:hypothetical protein